MWGSTLVFTFVAQVITGIFLWMCYSPSAQTAWESVYYIQYQTQGGWLLRGLHHFMAQAMVVLLALHLMQVVIDGAYRAPREVNFWLGLILMQIVLGLSLTGYLLPWDQKGYWATRVATNLLSIVPVVGPQLQQLVVGGTDYGHHTLTRFFALHAGVLPGLLVVFLVLHVALFRRHGICTSSPRKSRDAMFWPDQVLKDAVACLAVLVVVLLLVVQPLDWFSSASGGRVPTSHLGAELGARPIPSNQYSAARPEWYFLFLFQFLKLFEGWGEQGELLGAIVIPARSCWRCFLMPLVGRWKLGHRFNIALLVVLMIGVALLTGAAVNEDYRASVDRWRPASPNCRRRLTEVGSDDAKIAAHFDNDPAKIEAFRRQLAPRTRNTASRRIIWSAVERGQARSRAGGHAGLGSDDGIPASGAITLAAQRSARPRAQSCSPRIAPVATRTRRRQSRRGADGRCQDVGPQPVWLCQPRLDRRLARSRADRRARLLWQHVAPRGHDGRLRRTRRVKDWPAEEVQNVVDRAVGRGELKSQAASDQQDAATIEAGRKLIADAEHCASVPQVSRRRRTGRCPRSDRLRLARVARSA